MNSQHLVRHAKLLGTEPRENETDEELHRRLCQRWSRFKNPYGTVYDLVHVAEQAILIDTPNFCDLGDIRRRTALGMLSKNPESNIVRRLIMALRAFWSCL